MPKKASKEDFSRVRAILQRETKSGVSFDDAAKKAADEEPDAMRRILGTKDA